MPLIWLASILNTIELLASVDRLMDASMYSYTYFLAFVLYTSIEMVITRAELAAKVLVVTNKP